MMKKPYDGTVSDGYHTFDELYEFRLLYNAALFTAWEKEGSYYAHKSKLHGDGTHPFGSKNWFIVAAMLPEGQISNHYEMKHWDLFQIHETSKCLFDYDGHTSQDVTDRLRKLLEGARP